MRAYRLLGYQQFRASIMDWSDIAERAQGRRHVRSWRKLT
jgi:hypothetical protein